MLLKSCKYNPLPNLIFCKFAHFKIKIYFLNGTDTNG